MIKTFFLFILLSLATLCGFTQNLNLDSLLKADYAMKDDSLKVTKLVWMGRKIQNSDPEKSRQIFNDALIISRKINNKICEISALKWIGVTYKSKGEYDSAGIYFRQALNEALLIKNDAKIAEMYNYLGVKFQFSNDFDSAVYYYILSIKYSEKTNNYSEMANGYNNIGSIFGQQELTVKAKYYFSKALELAILDTTNKWIQGTCYFNIGNSFNHFKEYDSALYCFKKALTFPVKSTINNFKPQVAYGIAEIFNKKGNFKLAEVYIDSAIYFARNRNETRTLAIILSDGAGLMASLNNFLKAEQYLTEAKKHIDEYQDWELYESWNKSMYLLKSMQRKWDEAIKYQDAYYIYKDSIDDDDIKEKTSQLEIKFQSQKKQAQIIQLNNERQVQELTIKQRNLWLYLLIGSILAILSVVFLNHQNVRRKQQLTMQTNLLQQQEIRELEQEKQLIAASSIMQGQEVERSRFAKDLHDGLGGMLSGIKLNLSSMKGNLVVRESDAQLFARSLNQLDKAISEMRRVAHNMMPEALMKFGLNEAIQDFCDGINESKTVKMKFIQMGFLQPLEKSTEVILYRIIQELSNNAIKHAASENIFIQLIKHDKGITLTVEDDGKGFDPKQLKNIKGAGLQNVEARVDCLKGIMTVESEVGSGTSFNIEFPV